ncbi:MAG: tetratricopeptide repeat protein, partial [Alphaproteobacteria bacterium]|nr:tetratricopeptide repeat protein [Alphaproteobacteria bacterium]
MIYRFGSYEVDSSLYELRRDGAVQRVEPQVFDLLRYLIEHRDHVVTKDELIANVWNGRIVSDATLSSRIKAARRAIGDSGDAQTVIQTLHGRGLRFVAAVALDGDAGSSPPSTAHPASVAVLPFVNMSDDAEQAIFSDGITEDLITDLSKVSGLFVPARNACFVYKGTSTKPQEICQALGVRHVLEGSVRRAGMRIRVTAQLVEGATGGHLWAERYDRELTDVFTIQDDITDRIVKSLRVTLLPAERRAIARPRTSNLDAYQFYLRGRELFHRRSRQDYEIAKRMFERAIELAPDYARAHAGLANCESERYLFLDSDASPATILEASGRALELEPDLAEAHAARGLALSTLDRNEEAEREFMAALRINPQLLEALKFYGRFCFAQDRLEEAASLFERASRSAPDDCRYPVHLSQIYKDLARPVDARAKLSLAVDLAEAELLRRPENSHAAVLGAAAYARLGRADRARDLALLAVKLAAEDPL